MFDQSSSPAFGSASTTSHAVSRRGFLGAALALGTLPALSACSSLVAPRPDYGVEVLGALASRDAKVLNDADADLAALRQTQLTALNEEITRACGTRKDGKPVEECGTDDAIDVPLPPNATPKDVLMDARSNVALTDCLENRNTLRADHTARLATAVDGGLVLGLRAAGADWEELIPAVPVGDGLTADAEEQLSTALKAEYMLIYGVGVAAPATTADTTSALMARGDRHRTLRDRARKVLEASGAEVPEGAAGYMPKDVPSPQEKPVEYITALERYCAQAWEDVFKAAKNGALRLFALQAAGVAAGGAAAMAGNELEPLPGL